MLANDLKKGMRVRLRSGLWATMADNKRGVVRYAEVEEPGHEFGSVSVDELAYVIREDGSQEEIELTAAQKKKVEESNRIKMMLGL